MVISELLRILRAMKKEHGDIAVRIFDFEWHAFCDIDVEYIKPLKNKQRKAFLCLNIMDCDK